MVADRTKRIAELNDQLRARLGLASFGEGVPGTIMMTHGICSLPADIQLDIWFAVNRYDEFSDGNDPYGERDFGSLDIHGADTVFWKIDYYEDASCEAGAKFPEDPERSYRVLTIMLAEEY